MARGCTVCQHPERASIDESLVCLEPYTTVAKRYGLHPDAVRRHRLNHLSESLAGLATQEQEDRKATLLDRVETLIRRAEVLFNEAAASGRFNQSLDALKELRLQLELLGKATGELDSRPQVTVNLMATPEWLNMRGVILAALSPYPDARAALSGRLLEIEGETV